MIFTIIILFLTLAGAFGIIGWRIWQIRTGRYTMDAQYEPADWTELSVEAIRTRLVEWTKFFAHHSILFLLKIWMKTSYFLKWCDRFVRAKLTHLLHRNGHLPVGGAPSDYLKSITDSKNEMPHVVIAREEAVGDEIKNE